MTAERAAELRGEIVDLEAQLLKARLELLELTHAKPHTAQLYLDTGRDS
jgi:hypothetical protein